MTYKAGGSFTITLTTIFVVLKLTNLIAWSWWWVLSPLLLDLALVVFFLCLMCALTLVTPNGRITVRRNK